MFLLLFFFTLSPTTEFYSLSLHDALPIFMSITRGGVVVPTLALPLEANDQSCGRIRSSYGPYPATRLVVRLERSEEHTSELQSLRHLVCRLLLEKKKNKQKRNASTHAYSK